MKNKKLILYDSEADYVRRMSEYLENYEELSFEIHSYTEAGKLQDFLQEETPDIFLTAESVYDSHLQKKSLGIVMVLQETGTAKHPNTLYINKFQKADRVVKEILKNYARLTKEPVFLLKQQEHACIIGFYSPVKRCMQTSAAMTFGRLLSINHKTLYLNFENYAGIQGILKPGMHHDLSDLLYFFENTREKFLYHLQAMTEKVENLAYVPPMFASQNLIYITGRQWLEMLSEIAVNSDYEYILLDLSDNMQGLFDILRMCTKIYTITKEDDTAVAKLEQYKCILQMYEYQDVLKKTKQPVFPMFKTISANAEEMTKGDLVRYVQGLIREDFGIEILRGAEK